MGYPPAPYDYNGTYPTAYPGYDYYGQPGGYPPAPPNPGYDSSYYGQGWGGYDAAAPGGGYSTSYPGTTIYFLNVEAFAVVSVLTFFILQVLQCCMDWGFPGLCN